MARGKSEKENSGGKKGKEVGVPPPSTDQNTGELSSDESSDESAYEWESDREKKKDLSHTKNPQQRVARTNTRKTASQQKDEEGTGLP